MARIVQSSKMERLLPEKVTLKQQTYKLYDL